MLLPLSIPSPSVSFIQLGPLQVHFYALCILAGIVAASVWTNHRLVKRGAEPGVVLDFVLATVIFGIIGARVFHVLTHPGDYFGEGRNVWEIFAIWNGGIAIFGALMGGALGAFLATRVNGVKFWTFADALAPGLLLAQAFGRLGNWFNQELFGQPTDLPWGLEIEATNPAYPIGLPAGQLFHPTFLYEILWNLLGIAVILLLEKKFSLQWGRVLALYLIWYGLGRIVWETIRIDPSLVFLGMRTNVWAALLAVVVGIVIFIVQGMRHTGREKSAYRLGREWVKPGSVVVSENGEPAFVDRSDPDAPVEDPSNPTATSTHGTSNR